ncbi:hypothetical protein OPT61_g8538 [Boeremia exigua]|uniref:Uncharacterized protein n=1 Tax=Boeremia exigua TaxID=749465 RepID=A0ACC2HXV3_9PLEO|nr:hypothetical protein OPT61_g8538 [Boeremia exigua]
MEEFTNTSPAPSSSTASEEVDDLLNGEANDLLRQQIKDRREAYIQKASGLRARIEAEKADLKILGEGYEADPNPNPALHKRVMSTSNLLSSIIKNYNLAMDTHTNSVDLTDIPLSQSRVVEVERRLRAVEVALQGGVKHDARAVELEVMEGDVEIMDVDTLAEETTSAIAGSAMSRVELENDDWIARLEAAGQDTQDLPPVGHFKV